MNDAQPNSSTDRQKPGLAYCLTVFIGVFLLFEMQFVRIATDEIEKQGVFDADWILLTKDEKILRQKNIQVAKKTISDGYKNTSLWTDDHMNLLQILG